MYMCINLCNIAFIDLMQLFIVSFLCKSCHDMIYTLLQTGYKLIRWNTSQDDKLFAYKETW